MAVAGVAASEIRYGHITPGAGKNLEMAIDGIEYRLCAEGMSDLNLLNIRRPHSDFQPTEVLRNRQEEAIYADLGKYIKRARKVLYKKTKTMKMLAEELIEKKVLVSSDITKCFNK